MNFLLIYMAKVAVYLTAFYLVFSLMLSRDTYYSRNRVFILLSLASALLFPLINFHTLQPLNIQFFGKFLSEVFVTAGRNGPGYADSPHTASGNLEIIFILYTIGVAVFLLKFVTDLLNLLILIARQRNRGSRIIRFNGFNTSGFSALGYIFISSKLRPDEAGEIIRHEQNHLRQNHFLDIIFIELVVTFQWFNPIIYLFNRSLRAIHEFQADQDCLKSGIPVVNYQSLLLSQVFKSKAFNLTNSFSNPSLIKRRMVMMTKKRTHALANTKLLLVIPVTILVFLAISAYKEIPGTPYNRLVTVAEPVTTSALLASPSNSALSNKIIKSEPTISGKDPGKSIAIEIMPPPPPPPLPVNDAGPDDKIKSENDGSANTEPEPFVVVEEMPMFPGGESELLKFIGSNTQYPANAKEKNIQGKVIVRFCVTASGGVSQISVLKGVNPELDAEAMRVVGALPEFNPGRQGGKPVPVWYMVPITFTLH